MLVSVHQPAAPSQTMFEPEPEPATSEPEPEPTISSNPVLPPSLEPCSSLPGPSSPGQPPSPPSPSHSDIFDVGALIKSGNLNLLSRSNKLKIINSTPDVTYNYPITNMYGINRRFRTEWVKNHPWLHYSTSEDGVYCKACALFAPSDVNYQKLGTFVTKPFQLWTKQSTVFASHEETQYHQDAMTRMVAFRDSCSAPTQSVACMLNKEYEEQVA